MYVQYKIFDFYRESFIENLHEVTLSKLISASALI